MPRPLRSLLLIALVLRMATPARADEGDEPGADEADLQALMTVLKQETEIATKTRMNSDYVPGTVTVVQGEELEALGVRTAGEALQLVPGVMALLDPLATPVATVRGIVFPFNSGNIKIMVDGISMSQQSAALNSTLLQMPIEIVERIEFIRGPGSTIHGDFAFAGVLNIVTRQSGRSAFVTGGGFGTYGGGARVWSDRDEGRQHFGVSLAGMHASDALAAEGHDARETRFAGIASYAYRGFSASLSTVHRDRDESVAGTSASPYERDSVLELRHVGKLMADLETDARLSYLINRFELGDTRFKGSKLGAEWSLTWRGLRRHTFLFALGYSDTFIDDALHQPPLPPGGGQGPLPEHAVDETRRLASLSVQDQIDLSDELALILGARYERFDRFQDELTPRLALVWRATDRQVLKAQYAEGYRAPNFFELYSPGYRNDDVDPESIDDTELSYLYRNPDLHVRATLFSSHMSDLIQPVGDVIPPPPGEPTFFGNVGTARAKGAELEWEQHVSPLFKLATSVSYVDAVDKRLAFATGARWIGDLSLFFQPLDKLVATTHWYHVGPRGQDATAVDKMDLVDVTVSVSDLPKPGFLFRGGVKNVLGDDLLVVAARPGEVNILTFDTRAWWVQASYRF